MSGDGLSIGEMALRSGVSEGTLRMWETRYGFPSPRRLASGYRSYSARDLEQVRAVLDGRAAGLSLPSAIERARRAASEPPASVFRTLTERFPQLHPHVLPKPALVRLTHAIEDECMLRADHPLLLAAFQRERFYRQAQARWRELARGARAAIVVADFPRSRRPRVGPAEVPLRDGEPLAREWLMVCDSPGYAVCLAAWERPRSGGEPRRFETVWSVDPVAVREASRAFCEIVARSDASLVAGAAVLLGEPPALGPRDLQAAVDLTTRMVLYAVGGEA